MTTELLDERVAIRSVFSGKVHEVFINEYSYGLNRAYHLSREEADANCTKDRIATHRYVLAKEPK